MNYASSPDKAQEVAAEIIKLGGDAITVGANVAKRDELDKLINTVAEKWGGLDVLVNNAGGCAGRRFSCGFLSPFDSSPDVITLAGPYWSL